MTVRSSSISVLLAAWKDGGAVLDSNIFANLASVSCMYFFLKLCVMAFQD